MAYKISRLSKPEVRRSMSSLVVASVCYVVGLSCFDGPVLVLLAIKLHAEEFSIGLVTAIIPAALIFSLFSISAMEKFGKKKVLITGFSLATIFITPLFLLPYFQQNFTIFAGLALLFAATALRSIANSMGGVGWFPLLQDIVPQRITGKFFGNLRVLWQSAWFVSILAIAYFFRNGETQWWRFQAVFAVGFCAYAIRALAVITMSERKRTGKPDASPAITDRFKTAFGQPEIRLFLAYISFYFAAAFMAEPFKIKMLKDFGYSHGFILAGSACVCLGAVVSLRFWGRIADKFGSRAIFSISHVGMIITSLLWIFIEPSLLGSSLIFTLYFTSSIFNIANGLAQIRYMMHNVPADKQYLLTIIQFVAGCSIAAGPLFGGIFLANTKTVSFCFRSFSLNNYDLLFILTGLIFVVPHILRKKLRMTNETPTLEVLTILSRPLRNILGSFLFTNRNNK